MKLTTILCFSLLSSFAFAQKPVTAPTAGEPPVPHQNANKPEGMETKGAITPARVFFIEPKDGATVPTTFKIKMGVEGIKIRPAGEDANDVTSGHHHLTIDAEPVSAGTPVPTDATHMHFGKGQTEAEITLKPGKHKLTLQFADGAHRSFGPKLSQTITVTVK